MSPETAQKFVELITSEGNFEKEIKELTEPLKRESGWPPSFQWGKNWFEGIPRPSFRKNSTRSSEKVNIMDDLDFWTFLCRMEAEVPQFEPAAKEIKRQIEEPLSRVIWHHSKEIVKAAKVSIVEACRKTMEQDIRKQKKKLDSMKWSFLRDAIKAALRGVYDKTK
jgi:hypothetical protein